MKPYRSLKICLILLVQNMASKETICARCNEPICAGDEWAKYDEKVYFNFIEQIVIISFQFS
jgi:hypothetical protein